MPAPRRIALRIAEVLAALIVLSVVLVAPLRWLAPPTSAFMERARSELETDIHYAWTPLSEIAPILAICVLTAEDQRFPDHAGFDVLAIRKALAEDRSRTRGASTLSQQVAKNLYLWPGRSFVRKGLEAYFTVWIEILWPKQRILEVYLNIAEFGPGVFGAGAASERLFGKPASELSFAEATRLTAVLPNPHRMHAARPSAYVRGRALEIEMAVHQFGDRFRGVPWLAPLLASAPPFGREVLERAELPLLRGDDAEGEPTPGPERPLAEVVDIDPESELEVEAEGDLMGPSPRPAAPASH